MILLIIIESYFVNEFCYYSMLLDFARLKQINNVKINVSQPFMCHGTLI